MQVCRPAHIYFFSNAAEGHMISRIAWDKGWEVWRESYTGIVFDRT